MENWDSVFSNCGIKIPAICFPKKQIDLKKWAVVACDQFTSEPQYWFNLEKKIGNADSTLHMILPECFLHEKDLNQRKINIAKQMQETSAQSIDTLPPGFILVERKTAYGKTRHGLILAIDLEAYDFNPKSKALIRSTEATITSRLPVRIDIRRSACLEFPHTILLMDDPADSVLGPLKEKKKGLKKIYNFSLLNQSGRLKGWQINDPKDLELLAAGFTKLMDPKVFKEKHGTDKVFLFAVGDGNHSLAAAKVYWQELKKQNVKNSDILNHPSRYALVEVMNLYDPGLVFEPIHRFIKNVDPQGVLNHLQVALPYLSFSINRFSQMEQLVEASGKEKSNICVGIIVNKEYFLLRFQNPKSMHTVELIQPVLESYLSSHTDSKIDYIHGSDALIRLCQQEKSIGFFVPAMQKEDLFPFVINNGILPLKSFSMGEASEKRFYLEGRRIIP